jgi:hypothetical protein
LVVAVVGVSWLGLYPGFGIGVCFMYPVLAISIDEGLPERAAAMVVEGVLNGDTTSYLFVIVLAKSDRM